MLLNRRFNLRTPIYEETASYGHVGRTPVTVEKTFNIDGKPQTVSVRLFPWEETDCVDAIKSAFSIK